MCVSGVEVGGVRRDWLALINDEINLIEDS